MNPVAAPSREAMHGLILPPPVSFWPATPAWYALFAILALLLLWLGVAPLAAVASRCL